MTRLFKLKHTTLLTAVYDGEHGFEEETDD